MSDLSLPFEPQPRTEIDVDDIVLAAGFVVMAAKVPTVLGEVPALVFRYHLPGGPAAGQLQPIVVPLDSPEQGAQLVELVRAAVARAISS
jgi:hypothetical protein